MAQFGTKLHYRRDTSQVRRFCEARCRSRTAGEGTAAGYSRLKHRKQRQNVHLRIPIDHKHTEICTFGFVIFVARSVQTISNDVQHSTCLHAQGQTLADAQGCARYTSRAHFSLRRHPEKYSANIFSSTAMDELISERESCPRRNALFPKKKHLSLPLVDETFLILILTLAPHPCLYP